MTAAQQQIPMDVDARASSSRWTVFFFVAAIFLLLVTLGNPPVTRTQEARVLETSRQMLGTGWRGWMLPTLNGEPRLKKPPLAYWMTASAYLVGGVSEFVGRIPNATLGWCTLLATYLLTRRMLGHRIALASAAALLGSHHFFKFVGQAETDTPAMLFLTIAIGSLWIASTDSRARWMHLAAAACGGIVLAKGAPGIFVLVFLLTFCWIEHRWDLLKRFFLTGAPLTLLAIALPWYLYAQQHAGGSVFASEMSNTLRGGDHFDWPWVYIPWIFLAGAPWSVLLPLALYGPVRKWKADPIGRFLLIWFGSILIPLMINGNKQSHYLLMLMPPMMILIARYLMTLRRIERAVPFLLATACIAMPLIIGVLVPSLTHPNSREVASQIRDKFDDGPYVFFGENLSLPLCFNLRSAIPSVRTTEELSQIATPKTVVIAQIKNGVAPPPLPERFVHALKISTGDQTFDLYQQAQNP
jgi:4-amino-4-deoxy-L-arabinose transferase-like glycosyltransferase